MNLKKPIAGDIRDGLKLPALFAVFIGVSTRLCFLKNEAASSLGLNLLAGFIGSLVTVYGIDYLARQREERRMLPVRAAAYEDVRIMTAWALNLWKEMYSNSVGDAAPTSWQEVVSPVSVGKIFVALDINKPAKVIPSRSWGAYIDHTLQRIHDHAEKVLMRHSANLDPAVHGAVYGIVYHEQFGIGNLIALDRREGIPRPTNLGAYMYHNREWLEAVLLLHEWTRKAHKELTRQGISHVHAPNIFSRLEENVAPPARFDEGVLEQQTNVMRAWSKTQQQP